MKTSEIKALYNKLSEEDKEQIENIIWFITDDCTSDVQYIFYSLELAELVNRLKEEYNGSN